ncbi:MAG TPA: hypothetical protein DFS52_04475 [Myxococcales bacterium]|nr:hypothetical protein [Myxococcales bacterium]
MARRYTLSARMEEGALAELFKAQVEGGGEVLVKLFNPRFSDPAYARALGENGARTFALGHPQALGYEEVGMVRGRIAAVRAQVDGFNLGDALRRLMSKEVVLPPPLALFIVAEAAQTVACAHATDWAHGAITPGNILLGFDGKVRVVDFGALEAMVASPVLKAMASKGRHAYRAPEQKSPGAGKPAGDVYSLGAIAYELLTLREVAQVRGGGLSTKRDTLLAPSRLDRRLNARIDPVVMRALEIAPARRYRSAAELSEALRGLFSVLGYAPGANELARFVRDIFPNEVTVGPVGGELPMVEPFALDQVFGELPSAPQEVAFDFQDRISYTMAAPGEAEPTAETVPQAPEVAASSEAEEFEEWEAPPGVMSEAPRLARNLHRSGPQEEARVASVNHGPTEPAPTPRRARAKIADRADTPLETPAGDTLDSGLAAPKQASTSHDWHVPPPTFEPPPERPRVGAGVWLVAMLGFALLSGLVYFSLGKKLGAKTALLANVASAHLAPPVAFTPGETEPLAPAKAEPPAEATLTLEANVPAAVFIDGKDIGKVTPLVDYSLPPGRHTVLLVYKRLMKELTVELEPGAHEKRVEKLGRPSTKKTKRRSSKRR